MSCLWRTDGQPLWRDLSLLAGEDASLDHGGDEARQFIEGLADRLGVERRWVMPAYEDVWHYLAKERKLPVNLTPGTGASRTPRSGPGWRGCSRSTAWP